ncbi:MAG: hypothetical protein AAFZ65_05810 [Planctomycetota bacterium]
MADKTPFQQALANRIVMVGTIVVGVCAAIAIIGVSFGGNGDKASETAIQIITIILPVIGTWVGTVLAFYFGKENFEAAVRETRETLGQRLRKPVRDYAIGAAEIRSLVVADEAAAKALTLSKIHKQLADAGFYRMPILAQGSVALFVVHRQPLDSFFADRARAGATPDELKKLTLGELLESSQGERLRNSFATVPEGATLAEAKAAMESFNGCQDVFVTSTGDRRGQVLAWITNNEIQRAASA